MSGPVDVHHVEWIAPSTASAPPLLLIPGIPAIANDWASLAERLAPRRRVIAYDNRGSGQSPVPEGPYTTLDMAADGIALLDRLGIEQADVFGMSMGGMIAQELALGWADRVRRLVLGCTHCGIENAAPQPRATGRAFALRTDDWALRMKTLAPFAFAPGVDPALLEGFIAKKSADVQDPAGYAAQIAAVLAHDTYDRLPLIDCPTLVITGNEDQVIPAASSEPLAKRIPDARLEIVLHAGHLFFIEDPDTTVRLLDDFLGA